MNKVLFLDFDGVLHPTHSVSDAPFNRIDLLEEAISDVSLDIVISSSWRFTHNLEKMQRILPKSISNLIIGCTGDPVIGKHPRFNEIQAFLISNGLSNWKALDDSYWEFPTPCPQLIRCNPNTGITKKEVLQLKQWLSG